jgi:homoserine dehydrogenase
MTLAVVPNQAVASPASLLRSHAPVLRQTLAAWPDQDTPQTPAARPEPARPLLVLKFGSSVLRTPADAPEAVSEIYRAVREGRRVLAVVSAFQGVTDKLLAEAEAWGCPHDASLAPRYVAIGEESTAALLAIACDRAGLNACSLSAAELGLRAKGDPQAAEPVGLDPAAIDAAFKRCDVVIVPGFVAHDDGRTVLLGRGGSDLSAVYLAHALGAARVRLIKDVDGVYDRDPKRDGAALRFGKISWNAARDVAGKLVQGRALDFAQANRLEIEVGVAGAAELTVIGAEGGPPSLSRRTKPLRVAVAGCGVVGGGVVERLLARPDAYELTAILVRDGDKPREADIAALVTTDPEALLASKPDVVVDVLSGRAASVVLMQAALTHGVDVVSANKQAVISAHAQLTEAARESGARLLHSAAVGGGSPLIELVRRARRAGPVAEVEGVLNGTVNFMLDRLAKGESFEEALKAAQAAGLAEADPSADLDGRDAAAKLRILALEAFGLVLQEADVSRETLDQAVAARAAGSPLKQVARISFRRGRPVATVAFERALGFEAVTGDRNLVRVSAPDGRVWTAGGRGAGCWPTTESVFADLAELSMQRAG